MNDCHPCCSSLACFLFFIIHHFLASQQLHSMVHYVNLVFPGSSARYKVCLAEGTMLRDLREQARTIGRLKAPATSLYILRPDPPEHKKTAIEDADGRSDVQVHPSPETQDSLHLIELLVAPPIQYEPPNLIVIPISLDVMDVDLLFETNEIIFCAEPPCTQEELLEELWKVDSLLEGGHFIMLQNRQTGSRKKLLLDEGMRISDLREVAAVYVGCSFNRVRLYSELCHLPVINRYLDHSLVRDIFPCGFTAGIEILPDQIPMASFQGGAERLQEQFQESAHRLLPHELRKSRESVRSEGGTTLPQDFPPWFYPREFREPGITEHGPNGFNFAGIQHGVQMKRPTHEASIPHTLLPIDPRIPLYPAADVTRQPPARPAYTVETVYSDTEDEDEVDTIYHESVCPPPRRSPRFVPTTVPPKKKQEWQVVWLWTTLMTLRAVTVAEQRSLLMLTLLLMSALFVPLAPTFSPSTTHGKNFLLLVGVHRVPCYAENAINI